MAKIESRSIIREGIRDVAINLVHKIREEFKVDSCDGCKHSDIGMHNGSCDGCIRIDISGDLYEAKE